MVTKIHGQPKENNLTTLEKELIAIEASIPSMLGGGNHGHAGVIAEPAKYSLMTGGITFANPANPGVYPAGLQTNATAGTQAREESIHKELVPNMKSSKESNRDSRTSFRKQLKWTTYWKSKTKHTAFLIKCQDK